MNSTDLRDVMAGLGPGTRGNGCDICMEEIGVDDATITHINCENTFHKTCFDEWTDSNFVQHRTTTCPKCRMALNEPHPTLFDTLFGAPHSPFPPAIPSFTVPRLTTVQSDMYDYDITMRDSNEEGGFPTPALLHHFQTDQHSATLWVGDYFVRLRQAQNLSNEEAIARVIDCYLILDQAPVPESMDELEDQLEEGDIVTDLEIIDESGDRRIRPDVLDFFEEEPRRARDWLKCRMARTQRELALDYHQMHHLRRDFIRDVHREIRSRRSVLGGREQ
jgi:Ring finger domain